MKRSSVNMIRGLARALQARVHKMSVARPDASGAVLFHTAQRLALAGIFGDSFSDSDNPCVRHGPLLPDAPVGFQNRLTYGVLQGINQRERQAWERLT